MALSESIATSCELLCHGGTLHCIIRMAQEEEMSQAYGRFRPYGTHSLQMPDGLPGVVMLIEKKGD